ncbi:MAG: putative membrane protein YdbT with pleckstrin-like domain [Haloarculaceae archaeon]|jgi:uncharacterized membrane protein YdbT with pleckstrin-like domain
MPISWLDLLDGEQIIWRDHPSKWMLLHSAVLAIFLTVGYLALLYTGLIPGSLQQYLLYSIIALPLFCLPLALTELKRRNVEYLITNKRVAKKTGIIAREGDPINAAKIQNIQYNQSALQRILDLGELQIMTSGRGDVDMTWTALHHPDSVQDIVSKQKDENL